MSVADECIVKVLHTGISVYNMQESIEWYEKNLGFRLVQDLGYIPPMKVRITFLQRDDYQIELFEYDEPKPLPEDRLLPNTDFMTVGTKHMALQIRDYDRLKEYLLGNGVEIVHEPQMGGDRVMFIHDCNGVLIELICPPEQ